MKFLKIKKTLKATTMQLAYTKKKQFYDVATDPTKHMKTNKKPTDEVYLTEFLLWTVAMNLFLWIKFFTGEKF